MCYAFYLCGKNKLVKYFILQWLQASIAKFEESSAGFYAWLQMTPLTEGQLLQQVLLPNFEDVPQKTVLDRVLQAGAWKTDAELRDALASIAFVTKGLLLWQSCINLHSPFAIMLHLYLAYKILMKYTEHRAVLSAHDPVTQSHCPFKE